MKLQMFEKFKSAKTSNKIKILIVSLIFVVIIYLFLSSFTSTKKDVNVPESTSSLYFTYVKQAENRLSNVLNSVNGIENVNVFLNISQSPKITYLSEDKTSASQSSSGILLNTIVLAKDGTKTYPIVVLEEMPEILGVLIVAKGVGNAAKKMQIIDIVASVLNVSVSKVEVLEGK